MGVTLANLNKLGYEPDAITLLNKTDKSRATTSVIFL